MGIFQSQLERLDSHHALMVYLGFAEKCKRMASQVGDNLTRMDATSNSNFGNLMPRKNTSLKSLYKMSFCKQLSGSKRCSRGTGWRCFPVSLYKPPVEAKGIH